METILTVVHVLLAIGLVGLVLLQHGKGADAGAAFGSGASATVFGAQGSASFLSRATGALATLFFITSLALAYFAMQSTERQGLMDAAVPAATEAPAPESEVPMVPGEIPAETVESEIPAETLESEIPVKTVGSEVPVETVGSEVPAVPAEVPAPEEK